MDLDNLSSIWFACFWFRCFCIHKFKRPCILRAPYLLFWRTLNCSCLFFENVPGAKYSFIYFLVNLETVGKLKRLILVLTSTHTQIFLTGSIPFSYRANVWSDSNKIEILWNLWPRFAYMLCFVSRTVNFSKKVIKKWTSVEISLRSQKANVVMIKYLCTAQCNITLIHLVLRNFYPPWKQWDIIINFSE